MMLNRQIHKIRMQRRANQVLEHWVCCASGTELEGVAFLKTYDGEGFTLS